MKQCYEPNWKTLKNRPAVFVWIPKTAGTSVRAIIERNEYPIQIGGGGGWEHASYKEIVKPLLSMGEPEPTIVTVVRNPYDWLVSYFHQHSSQDRPGGQESALGNWESFEDFLRKFDSGALPRFMRTEGFITEQLYDEKNHCKADVIIRFEHLQAGWGKTVEGLVGCERLRNGLSLPYKNRGEGHSRNPTFGPTPRNYRKYYTEEMVEFVEKRFGKEMSMYGYTIDGPIDDSIFVDPAKCHR